MNSLRELLLCIRINIDIAVVSSLGADGLQIISPSSQHPTSFDGIALLGHEAELHYHSLEPANNPKPVTSSLDAMRERYGEGVVTEEICIRCGKKFKSVSSGVHVSESGCVRSYSDDQVVCDLCGYLEHHPLD